MRWPWQRKTAPQPAWVTRAHCHALVMALIAERFGVQPELADLMRDELLARARLLVEVLQPPAPRTRGNVLKFARKS